LFSPYGTAVTYPDSIYCISVKMRGQILTLGHL
jgi:hypothetical protein